MAAAPQVGSSGGEFFDSSLDSRTSTRRSAGDISTSVPPKGVFNLFSS